MNPWVIISAELGSCAITQNPSGEIQDIVQNADLMEKLGQSGHYTLFAPTNEAFESLGSDVLERLQSDKEVLKGKLGYMPLFVHCSKNRGLKLNVADCLNFIMKEGKRSSRVSSQWNFQWSSCLRCLTSFKYETDDALWTKATTRLADSCVEKTWKSLWSEVRWWKLNDLTLWKQFSFGYSMQTNQNICKWARKEPAKAPWSLQACKKNLKISIISSFASTLSDGRELLHRTTCQTGFWPSVLRAESLARAVNSGQLKQRAADQVFSLKDPRDQTVLQVPMVSA